MTDDGWFRNERGNLCKRYGPEPTPGPVSSFPCPRVIGDTMEPTQHVDGRHYTSKSQYRAVTKAHGMIEVGNDPARFRPNKPPKPDRKAIKEAVQRAFAIHNP